MVLGMCGFQTEIATSGNSRERLEAVVDDRGGSLAGVIGVIRSSEKLIFEPLA